MNQTVHDTKDTAKDKAQEVGQQAQEKAKGQIDSRTSQAGDQLNDKAEGLHEVGDQLREQGNDTFAQVADRVADWTEDAARYLRNADADRLLGDVEGFARRQPWAVAAGGLLLGFAASRVVRAGSERRSGDSSSDSSSDSSIGRYSTGNSSDEPIDLTRGSGTGTGYGTLPTGYEPLPGDRAGDPLSTTDPGTTPTPAPSTQPGPSSTGFTDGNR